MLISAFYWFPDFSYYVIVISLWFASQLKGAGQLATVLELNFPKNCATIIRLVLFSATFKQFLMKFNHKLKKAAKLSPPRFGYVFTSFYYRGEKRRKIIKINHLSFSPQRREKLWLKGKQHCFKSFRWFFFSSFQFRRKSKYLMNKSLWERRKKKLKVEFNFEGKRAFICSLFIYSQPIWCGYFRLFFVEKNKGKLSSVNTTKLIVFLCEKFLCLWLH